MTSLKTLRNHPKYKWVVVAACFLMVMVALGFGSSPKGLFLTAITKALEMDRAPFSINDSCRYIATAVVNLFFGTLVLRFGPRKLVGAGFACLALSMLVYSLAETLPVFYLGGALLGIGLSWTSTTMVGFVVGRWCSENKGTIMGAVLAANGVGGAIATQIVGPIINGSVFGYRAAYRVIAIVMLAVGVLAVVLLKDRPESQPVVAVSGTKPLANGWEGLTLKVCLRKPYFYAVLAAVFLTGVVIQSAAGIYAAHMEDVGLDRQFITTVVSSYTLCIVGTKFLTGFLYDKLGLTVTLMICSVAAVGAMVVLAVMSPAVSWLAFVFAVVYAISVPLETIMLPLITADMFGNIDSAHILGILVSVSTAGYAVGTPVVNLFYDLQGSYQTVLLIMAGVMVGVSTLNLLALNAAHKLRKQSET